MNEESLTKMDPGTIGHEDAMKWREFINKASYRDLFFINDLIAAEMRARHERFINAQAKIQVLEEERCIYAFMCDRRGLPKSPDVIKGDLH